MFRFTRPHFPARLDGATLSALACGAFLLWFIWTFGNRGFAGLDTSAHINAGWWLLQNGNAYHDSLLPLPPGFSLLVKLAIRYLGARWTSLITVLATCSLVSFYLHCYLLSRLMGKAWAICIAFTCQAMAVLLPTVLLYNNLSVIAACLAISAAAAFQRESRSLAIQASLVLSLAFLALLKPNVAGLFGAILFLSLASSRGLLMRTFALFLLAGATAAGTLLVNGVHPMDVLNTYRSLSATRGLPSLENFQGCKLADFYLSAPTLVLLALLVFTRVWQWGRLEKRARERALPTSTVRLLAGCALGSVLVLFYDNEMISVEIAPLVMITSLLWIGHGLGEPDSPLPRFFSLEFFLGSLGLLLSGLALAGYSMSFGSFEHFTSLLIGALLSSFSRICLVAMLVSVLILAMCLGSSAIGRSPHPDISFAATSDRKKVKASSYFIGFYALLVVASVLIGATRWRGVMVANPPELPGALVETNAVDFFRNFHISARAARMAEETKDSLERFLSAEARKSRDKVFFGIRMEYGYAAFAQHSPEDLPLYWARGTTYRDEQVPEITQKFIDHRFELCILPSVIDSGPPTVDYGYEKGGLYFVPRLLRNYIDTHYDVVFARDIVVFKRKPGS